LTAGEPEFLYRHGCRLALVYNGVRSAPGSRAQRADGERAAEDAMRQASLYGIVGKVRIYLDLEGWLASPDFLEGWCDAMHGSLFAGAGGFYGRGAEVRPRRGSYMPNLDRPVFSGGWSRQVVALEERSVEQRSTATISNLSQGVSAKPYSLYLWSNTPRRYDEHADTPRGAEIIPQSFGAVGPVGTMLSDTVIWQYRFGAFWASGAQRGSVDLDLATELGYQEMWGV
jgi:hypothetical protein